ncbi:MAG TPA: hypothetical protein VGC57_08600 [Cellulomonas sp.]
MTTTLALLALLALTLWWAVRLVVTVRGDGYGTRRPPTSHHDRGAGPDPLVRDDHH